MAKKISDLTPATALGDSDSFVFNDVAAGNDKRVTAAALKSALDLATNESVDNKASLLVPKADVAKNVKVEGAKGDRTDESVKFTEFENSENKYFTVPPGFYDVPGQSLSKIYTGEGKIDCAIPEQPNDVTINLNRADRRIGYGRVTNSAQYAAWPQGKTFTYNGVIYQLFNEGKSHGDSSLAVYMVSSKDGKNWTEPSLVYWESGYAAGTTCWGAGADSNGNFWAIIRRRGGDYQTGTDHILIKSTDLGETWTVELNPIGFTYGGYVPIEYHSFAELGNGNIAFGYHFETATEGKTGIIQFDTTALTYNASDLHAPGAFPPGRYVEPSIYYDATEGATVGFIRTENDGVKIQFWKSTDNCSTFTITDTDVTFPQSPVPITKVGSKYVANAIQRGGYCVFLLMEAEAQDALSNGGPAFSKEAIGEVTRYNDGGASGLGVSDIVTLGEEVFIVFSFEETNDLVNLFYIRIDYRDNAYRMPYFNSENIIGVGRIPRKGSFDPSPVAVENIDLMGSVVNAEFTRFGPMVMFQFVIKNVDPTNSGTTRIEFDLPVLTSTENQLLGGTAYHATSDRDFGAVINKSTGNDQIDQGLIVLKIAGNQIGDVQVSGYYLI